MLPVLYELGESSLIKPQDDNTVTTDEALLNININKAGIYFGGNIGGHMIEGERFQIDPSNN